MNPRIAILILNWNNWQETEKCLKSLEGQDFLSFEVFLVDNGSSNHSVSQIKDILKKTSVTCHFQSLPENLGFAGGVNQGLQLIFESTIPFSHILLLNNDASMLPSTLSELLKVASQSHSPLISARGVDALSQKTYFTGFKLPDFLFGRLVGYPINESLNAWPTDYCEGSALLLDVQFVRKLTQTRGYFFDEALFLYCEDLELGFYSKSHNVQMFVAQDAVLLHQVSQSSGGKGNPLAYYYITRNRIRLANQYFQFPLRLLFHIYYVPSRFLLIAKNSFRSTKVAHAQLCGLIDGYASRWGRWKNHPL